MYVRTPIEWYDLFEEWLSTLPAGEKAIKYKDSFKEMYIRLDGKLYGHRTAGSVYRNEVEAIICERIDPQRYQFQRGVKDPCLSRCLKTGVILVHHVDDIRAAGPAEVLADLFEKEFPKYCEVQAGEPSSQQRVSPRKTVQKFRASSYRPAQTVGSSAEAGSTSEAAPGQEPEPEEADNPLRDPFANMTPEELADFQRAEDRNFGVDRLGEKSERAESGHS